MDLNNVWNNWGTLIVQIITLIGFLWWLKFKVAEVEASQLRHEVSDKELHSHMERRLETLDIKNTALEIKFVEIHTMMKGISKTLDEIKQDLRAK